MQKDLTPQIKQILIKNTLVKHIDLAKLGASKDLVAHKEHMTFYSGNTKITLSFYIEVWDQNHIIIDDIVTCLVAFKVMDDDYNSEP